MQTHRTKAQWFEMFFFFGENLLFSYSFFFIMEALLETGDSHQVFENSWNTIIQVIENTYRYDKKSRLSH